VDEPGDGIFKALRHSLRRQIVRLMIELDRPISPLELGRRLEVPTPNVGYHVRVLAQMDVLILFDEEAVAGSIQHFYELDKELAQQAWFRGSLGLGPVTGDEDPSREKGDGADGQPG
jgi:DNA-binding transcriptional ArsR family regulator